MARPGVAGLVERVFTSLMLPRIYRKELALLAKYLAGQERSGAPGSGHPTAG